jgi:hypothetical protein
MSMARLRRYLNPGASGAGYIATVKRSVGAVRARDRIYCGIANEPDGPGGLSSFADLAGFARLQTAEKGGLIAFTILMR